MHEESKKPNPDHVRRDFNRLAWDWVQLRWRLPKPVQQENGRRSAYREYGHPAEWASDKAAQIAALFHSWHEMLADERNETPPPPTRVAEVIQVSKAWTYLEPRIEQLVKLVEPEAFRELVDLHHQIGNALGYGNPKQVLPIPCPDERCGLRTLTRNIAVGKDYIVCGSCGYSVSERYYPLLVRITLDTLIESALIDN